MQSLRRQHGPGLQHAPFEPFAKDARRHAIQQIRPERKAEDTPGPGSYETAGGACSSKSQMGSRIRPRTAMCGFGRVEQGTMTYGQVCDTRQFPTVTQKTIHERCGKGPFDVDQLQAMRTFQWAPSSDLDARQRTIGPKLSPKGPAPTPGPGAYNLNLAADVLKPPAYTVKGPMERDEWTRQTDHTVPGPGQYFDNVDFKSYRPKWTIGHKTLQDDRRKRASAA
jgi:hypothetical protein